MAVNSLKIPVDRTRWSEALPESRLESHKPGSGSLTLGLKRDSKARSPERGGGAVEGKS